MPFSKSTIVFLLSLSAASVSYAQSADSTLQNATLENIIQYTLEHQPAVQQSTIDEKITEKTIKGKLADWFPQVNFAYNYQHVIDLQYAVFGGEAVQIGVQNTSTAQFTATQTIFNRDVLLAANTASRVRIQAEQATSKTKIDAVVNVSKAFYDLLATSQQIKVNQESIIRLKRSLKDAQSRYNAGVADKTDYKRATILLANAEVALKTNQELLKFKEKYLKTLMGYPMNEALPLSYDSATMERETALDTLQEMNHSSHIDYKLLATQRELQKANVKYNYWSYLPSLSANGAYNLNYLNDDLSKLYDRRYPYSYVGATLSFPIFQGGKRMFKIQEQKYVQRRIDVAINNLQRVLTTEYSRALASYKSNLANYLAQRENVALAAEVYDVIELQYRNGVRTYLDVTIAESDLNTTRINYFNALNLVLSSKIDVQRALGQINY
jgi:outer membrane protein